ncbi:DNA primase small subunit [Nematocida sp. AWRm80]|nr:DNA primase small subunit [Nematocida sp. AWRm80]
MSSRESKEMSLRKYYQEIFPAEEIFLWLRYTKTREFAFTFCGTDGFARYITFNSQKEMRDRLLKDTPKKIDAGAVYLHKPATMTVENMAMIKELVFDIDLTDYTRDCCSKDSKDICNQCFPLIKCAVEVLDYLLRTDFGYKKILFVFSGGRGVHCWVSDPSALTLTCRDRSNVSDYITRIPNAKDKDPKLTSILNKYYNPGHQNENASNTQENTTQTEDKYNLSAKEIDQMYERLFPKLDSGVTKQTKHLLKLPFCVHPNTNRICIPLDPLELDTLRLEDIPTLTTALTTPEHLSKYLKYFTDNHCSPQSPISTPEQ